MNAIRIAIVAAVLLGGIVMSCAEERPMKRPPFPMSRLRPRLTDGELSEKIMEKQITRTKRSARGCNNLYPTCRCYYYKLRGFCDSPNAAYRNWMETYCNAACGMCTSGSNAEACINRYGDRICDVYIQQGYQNNPRYQYAMACSCTEACGLCNANPPPWVATAAPANPSAFREKCLRLHNQYRAQHNAADLTWDDRCAQFAQRHADTLQRLGRGPYHSLPRTRTWTVDGQSVLHGENIAFIHPRADPEGAINRWYAEKDRYDPRNPVRFFHYSSHFTQLVWKSSNKVGCGINGAYFVCIYQPTGNILRTADIQANVDA